jgi:hypothetical protein
MANSPSQKWENGVMVSRAAETNRWRVLPDGSEVGEVEEVEPKATRDYKAPVPTKMVADDSAENKAVSSRSTSTKSRAKK